MRIENTAGATEDALSIGCNDGSVGVKGRCDALDH
jgi:hypothetical protein